jgi:hypothetical protein
MSYFRSLSATLLLAAITFSIASSSCATNAIGVDDCRDIEQARCRAGEACGVVTDVDECVRYYRDHCLHGLAVKPAVGSSVTDCVEVIQAAGRCAAVDPDSKLSACEETVTKPKGGFTKACDVVAHPERADECSFLLATPEADGGAGESAGGQAGTAGTAGTGGVAGEPAQGGAAGE